MPDSSGNNTRKNASPWAASDLALKDMSILSAKQRTHFAVSAARSLKSAPIDNNLKLAR
jgi:hypothetical protein